MNLFNTHTEQRLPDEVKKRLTYGLLISLVIHAFVLSLQFGIPGLALPDLEAPWSKRRAATPDLSIQIANTPATVTTATAPELAAPAVSVVTNTESKYQNTPASDKKMPESTPTGLQLLAPRASAVVAPRSKSSVLAPKSKTKQDATSATRRSRPLAAPDITHIIAQDAVLSDFVVAVPDPEDVHKKMEDASAIAKDAQSEEILMKAAESQKKRQLHEDKMLRQAEIAAMQKSTDNVLPPQLIQQMDEENRQQADDASRRQLAALTMQRQAEADEQSRREQEAERAEALRQAAQRRVAAQQRRTELVMQVPLDSWTQERKQQQDIIIEQQRSLQADARVAESVRLQEERRQAQQLAQQLEEKLKAQAEELLSKKKNEENLAKQKVEQAIRQQAERAAMQQREREQVQVAAQVMEAATKATTASQALPAAQTAQVTAGSMQQAANANIHQGSSTGDHGNTAQVPTAQVFVLPKSLLGSELANRAREQARGLDLLRGTPPMTRSESDERPRRRSVFGSAEKDVPLRMYIDSWKQKIERNGNLNYSQLAKDKARGDPVVHVAIRSDGSVEEITIIRSSGRADLDEAVRRIVRLNARYAAFPPNIAAQYDVIEIRRVWNFDETLKILEEMR
ncbi:TonB family protein [Undibacterium sp. SXout7W]|uniref:energy transducer TonB n=1 Tax=Undibacterium sp. SXout7W TaxID=3413049 RepID=UPI003BF28030